MAADAQSAEAQLRTLEAKYRKEKQINRELALRLQTVREDATAAAAELKELRLKAAASGPSPLQVVAATAASAGGGSAGAATATRDLEVEASSLRRLLSSVASGKPVGDAVKWEAVLSGGTLPPAVAHLVQELGYDEALQAQQLPTPRPVPLIDAVAVCGPSPATVVAAMRRQWRRLGASPSGASRSRSRQRHGRRSNNSSSRANSQLSEVTAYTVSDSDDSGADGASVSNSSSGSGSGSGSSSEGEEEKDEQKDENKGRRSHAFSTATTVAALMTPQPKQHVRSSSHVKSAQRINRKRRAAVLESVPSEVLWHYPPTAESLCSSLPDFAHPHGAALTLLSLPVMRHGTPDEEEQQRADGLSVEQADELFGASTHRRGPASHLFILTGAADDDGSAVSLSLMAAAAGQPVESRTRYVMCMRVLEPTSRQALLGAARKDGDAAAEAAEAAAAEGHTAATWPTHDPQLVLIPRVLCVVSRYPFFEAHWQLLQSLASAWRAAAQQRFHKQCAAGHITAILRLPTPAVVPATPAPAVTASTAADPAATAEGNAAEAGDGVSRLNPLSLVPPAPADEAAAAVPATPMRSASAASGVSNTSQPPVPPSPFGAASAMWQQWKGEWKAGASTGASTGAGAAGGGGGGLKSLSKGGLTLPLPLTKAIAIGLPPRAPAAENVTTVNPAAVATAASTVAVYGASAEELDPSSAPATSSEVDTATTSDVTLPTGITGVVDSSTSTADSSVPPTPSSSSLAASFSALFDPAKWRQRSTGAASSAADDAAQKSRSQSVTDGEGGQHSGSSGSGSGSGSGSSSDDEQQQTQTRHRRIASASASLHHATSLHSHHGHHGHAASGASGVGSRSLADFMSFIHGHDAAVTVTDAPLTPLSHTDAVGDGTNGANTGGSTNSGDGWLTLDDDGAATAAAALSRGIAPPALVQLVTDAVAAQVPPPGESIALAPGVPPVMRELLDSAAGSATSSSTSSGGITSPPRDYTAGAGGSGSGGHGGHGGTHSPSSQALQMVTQLLQKSSKAGECGVPSAAASSFAAAAGPPPSWQLGSDLSSPEAAAAITHWAMPLLLSVLPMDSLLLLVGAALTEHKLLFVGGGLNQEVTSSCVLAMAALLRPLMWVGPFLPTLPPSLNEVLTAPLPLLAGLPRLPPGFEQDEATVIVLLDRETVRIPALRKSPSEADADGDSMVHVLPGFLEMQLPGNSALYHLLYPVAAPLRAGNGGRGADGRPLRPRPCYRPTTAQLKACSAVVTAITDHVRNLISRYLACGLRPIRDARASASDATASGATASGATGWQYYASRLPPLHRCAQAITAAVPEVELPFWSRFGGSQMLACYVDDVNQRLQLTLPAPLQMPAPVAVGEPGSDAAAADFTTAVASPAPMAGSAHKGTVTIHVAPRSRTSSTPYTPGSGSSPGGGAGAGAGDADQYHDEGSEDEGSPRSISSWKGSGSASRGGSGGGGLAVVISRRSYASPTASLSTPVLTTPSPLSRQVQVQVHHSHHSHSHHSHHSQQQGEDEREVQVSIDSLGQLVASPEGPAASAAASVTAAATVTAHAHAQGLQPSNTQRPHRLSHVMDLRQVSLGMVAATSSSSNSATKVPLAAAAVSLVSRAPEQAVEQEGGPES